MKTLIDKLKRTAGAGRSEPEQELDPAVYTHRLLFVCMGNICRSPTAEGVFRKVLAEREPELAVFVDSAGTHAYHVGEPPDQRARRAAERRGIDLSAQRARLVTLEDFERFDLLLVMDELNRSALHEMGPPEHRDKVRLLLEFAPQLGRTDVPDPYYGAVNGFEYVLDLVEEASIGLLEHLRRTRERRDTHLGGSPAARTDPLSDDSSEVPPLPLGGPPPARRS